MRHGWLTAGEIGLDYTLRVGWLLTLTEFWNELKDPWRPGLSAEVILERSGLCTA